MSKKQKFYCKLGQAVCNIGQFSLGIAFLYVMLALANTLANLI